MDFNNEYLLKLLKAAIYDITPEQPDKQPDWNYIYEKSSEQKIEGIVYCSVKRLAKEYKIDEEILAKWNKKMMSTFMFSSRQYNEFKNMTNVLISKNIKFIGLKGCILRNIYPVPELRTMGDFDILVNKKDLQTIKTIFAENGYEIKKDYVGIVCFKNNIVWEIFTTLEEEFKNNTEIWDKEFLENTINKENIPCPEYTLFFLHLIVHTAKHLISKGAGIRNLCDIALYLKKYKELIDFPKVEKGCKEQGFYKIYSHIVNAVCKHFDVNTKGINVIKTDSDGFTEYMLLNGIYGKHDNSILSQLTKTENKSDSLLKRLFFPPVKVLKHRYKYLVKFPFLLPAAWVHRYFSALFRLKLSTGTMIKDTANAVEYSKVREKWIDKLDLLD